MQYLSARYAREYDSKNVDPPAIFQDGKGDWVSVRLDLYICKLEHRYVAVYLLLTPPPDKTLLRFMSELISSPQSRATYNND